MSHNRWANHRQQTGMGVGLIGGLWSNCCPHVVSACGQGGQVTPKQIPNHSQVNQDRVVRLDGRTIKRLFCGMTGTGAFQSRSQLCACRVVAGRMYERGGLMDGFFSVSILQ